MLSQYFVTFSFPCTNCICHPIQCIEFKAMANLEKSIPEVMEKNSSLRREFTQRLWVLRFDTNSDCLILAKELWEDLELGLERDACAGILCDAMRNDECIRISAAAALKEALSVHKAEIKSTLGNIGKLYEAKAKVSEIYTAIFDRSKFWLEIPYSPNNSKKF